MNEKQTYIVAILGLGVLIFWVSKSQRAQFSLINSASSPYNTGNPEKTDKKLHKMNINRRILPSLSSLTGKGRDKESAKLTSEAKFPDELDATPVSQHETYAREKGVVAVAAESETLIHTSVPTFMGDRADVVVPGEKLEVY